MNHNKNHTIGILSVTATILLVGIILNNTNSHHTAMAIGQLDRGGDYVILTGQFTNNTELLYITDAAVQRLNVYSYEPTLRQFVIWDSIDLAQITGRRRRK